MLSGALRCVSEKLCPGAHRLILTGYYPVPLLFTVLTQTFLTLLAESMCTRYRVYRVDVRTWTVCELNWI